MVALAGGAAIEQQHLLEDVEVDLQVEAVGGFSRQDLLDVVVVDADVVRLVEDARHALDHARLHDGALVRREGARHQQVAVGAERLVGLLELVQLRVVLLAAPVIEVAEEAARLFRLPAGQAVGAVRRSSSAKRVTGMKRSLPRALSGITASKAETFSSVGAAAAALPVILAKKPVGAAVGAACTSVEDMFGLPSGALLRG